MILWQDNMNESKTQLTSGADVLVEELDNLTLVFLTGRLPADQVVKGLKRLVVRTERYRLRRCCKVHNRRAFQKIPWASAMYSLMGDALGRDGHKDEACAAFEKARDLDKEWPTSFEHYVEYLLSEGDVAKCATVIMEQPIGSIANKGSATAERLLDAIRRHKKMKKMIHPAVIQFCKSLCSGVKPTGKNRLGTAPRKRLNTR
jgi:hypothetical protein